MLTASDIAKETKIDLPTVRYRLFTLRHEGEILGEQFGLVWVYDRSVIDKIVNFETRK